MDPIFNGLILNGDEIGKDYILQICFSSNFVALPFITLMKFLERWRGFCSGFGSLRDPVGTFRVHAHLYLLQTETENRKRREQDFAWLSGPYGWTAKSEKWNVKRINKKKSSAIVRKNSVNNIIYFQSSASFVIGLVGLFLSISSSIGWDFLKLIVKIDGQIICESGTIRSL